MPPSLGGALKPAPRSSVRSRRPTPARWTTSSRGFSRQRSFRLKAARSARKICTTRYRIGSKKPAKNWVHSPLRKRRKSVRDVARLGLGSSARSINVRRRGLWGAFSIRQSTAKQGCPIGGRQVCPARGTLVWRFPKFAFLRPLEPSADNPE